MLKILWSKQHIHHACFLLLQWFERKEWNMKSTGNKAFMKITSGFIGPQITPQFWEKSQPVRRAPKQSCSVLPCPLQQLWVYNWVIKTKITFFLKRFDHLLKIMWHINLQKVMPVKCGHQFSSVSYYKKVKSIITAVAKYIFLDFLRGK